jgi:endonuclease/exonuclease/phosphatase family metal-dependent hydrolase
MSAAVGPATPPAADERRLRLLSCNILAGGSMRGYRDYVTHSWKHVLPAGKRANLDGLAALIGEFDMVALQEADAGSLRSGFLNQTQYLAETAGFPYWSHQPNRRVSHLASSSNGLLARSAPDEVLDYPLPGRIPGRGALWARFGSGRDALILIVAHLSLGPSARARQLGFIAELIGDNPQVILMGDLNTPSDSAELRMLYSRTSLAPPQASLPTFPSWRPRRALDHILVSHALELEKLWVVPHPVSDHLPIAASVRLPARSATPLEEEGDGNE